MDLSTDECFDILKFETMDGVLVNRRASVNFCDETDSGICSSDCNTNVIQSRTCDEGRNLNTPVIMINNDNIVDNIEMAEIESYYERILTPEGNVKYKNYRILAPAPMQLRMYSPSGDIHTTPKKGKIVPKFDIFHNSLCPRDKLLSLIDNEHLASSELVSIINPGISRRVTEMLRKTNKSSMADRIEFLNSVYSPSPSSLSILSDESVFVDRYIETPDVVETNITTPSLLMKSFTVDIEESYNLPATKNKIIRKQTSLQINDGSIYQMNLSDELRFAEEPFPRSYTPRKMTEFEYYFFHRPSSSLSHKHDTFVDADKPRESKKSMIRNFIQRNMIDRSSHRDELAKLALAIEEDTESESLKIVSSVRELEDKLAAMLEEVKIWKTELIEIQEDIQEDDRKVTILIEDAKFLLREIKSTNYLDELIHLLKGNLDAVAKHKTWPFTGYANGKRNNYQTNLIV